MSIQNPSTRNDQNVIHRFDKARHLRLCSIHNLDTEWPALRGEETKVIKQHTLTILTPQFEEISLVFRTWTQWTPRDCPVLPDWA